mmetsp:Transcript_1182/g.1703  ORF Transcript_1182/g.1703 Transcript_1182/m.1703 type:complete len:396 (-) Transcript_1182:164-1351(-)
MRCAQYVLHACRKNQLIKVKASTKPAQSIFRLFREKFSSVAMAQGEPSVVVGCEEKDLRFAAERLRDGKLVAFPTETVYGLGANALNKDAVLDIFRAKGRPLTDPLIVHVENLEQGLQLADIDGHTKEVFVYLTEKFWPGPLTLVVKAKTTLPLELSAGTGYVGIRCPAYELARTLIKYAKVPIAAPSANRFGHVSPTSSEHVINDLFDKSITVIDGGSCCNVGIESTVLKIDETKNGNHLVLYRKGGIPENEIKDALTEKGWMEGTVISTPVRATRKPKSVEVEEPIPAEPVKGSVAPGQELKHYAPDADTWLISPTVADSLMNLAGPNASVELKTDGGETSNMECNKAVLIDFKGSLSNVKPYFKGYYDLSLQGDVTEAARLVFETLRKAEKN